MRIGSNGLHRKRSFDVQCAGHIVRIARARRREEHAPASSGNVRQLSLPLRIWGLFGRMAQALKVGGNLRETHRSVPLCRVLGLSRHLPGSRNPLQGLKKRYWYHRHRAAPGNRHNLRPHTSPLMHRGRYFYCSSNLLLSPPLPPNVNPLKTLNPRHRKYEVVQVSAPPKQAILYFATAVVLHGRNIPLLRLHCTLNAVAPLAVPSPSSRFSFPCQGEPEEVSIAFYRHK